MKRALLDALLAARQAGTEVALVTDLGSGAQCLVTSTHSEGELSLARTTLAVVREAIAADRSALLAGEEGRLFVHVFVPHPRLIIIGAVHIAQPLVRIARTAGLAVTVVDPRRAYASRPNFEDVPVIEDWPDAALQRLAPDARTAIVTLTHDPKLDDPALVLALRSTAFYIGALGSRRTQAARRDRLRAVGFDEAALKRIHGPVGLAIGAVTPAEIAVAIVGEIIAVRRAGPAADAGATAAAAGSGVRGAGVR